MTFLLVYNGWTQEGEGKHVKTCLAAVSLVYLYHAYKGTKIK